MSVSTESGVAIGPGGIYTKWILVTPDVAKSFLEKNTKNRTIRPQQVERLASQMRSGVYKKTHQGVAFDSNGVMADGQHTCEAIIQTGMPQWKLVTYNIEVGSRGAIDRGAQRTVSDNVSLAGYGNVSSREIAAIYATLMGMNNRGYRRPELSPEQIHDLRVMWVDEILVASPNFTTKVVGNAAINGICIRAMLSGACKDRVGQFLEVLRTGMPQSKDDETAVNLRNRLLSNEIVIGRGAAEQSRTGYLKVSAVLRLFLERSHVGRIQAAHRELFTIPPSRIPESVYATISDSQENCS